MGEAFMSILIIDRSKDIRDFLKEFLGIIGFGTIATDCPIEAIGLVRAHRPRVIMAEYNLPEVAAFDLKKAVENFRKSGKIFLTLNEPLIFLPPKTLGESEEREYEKMLAKQRALTYGVDMVFTKPLLMDRILPYLN